MLLYFVFVLGIGFALKRFMKTSKDFFQAGQALPVWICGLAFISANLGAQEVIGMGASGAKYGIATDDATYEAVAALAARLGKTTAMAEDFPGFMANRILMPMINEAVYTLYEGVGTITSIDTAMKLGCNHPMGPLELADFIGLDTCLSIMQVLLDGLSDTKYRPCPLLVKYVEAGWLGRKTGRGFYDYSVTPPKPTR